MKYKYLLPFLCLSPTISICGQTNVRKIRPSDTDPLISTFNSDSNYVYFNANIPSKNILVIHLPGSFGEPKRATLFGTLAADLGFHSIGLMYPNVPTVGSFCTNSSDVNCYENVRREIVEGIDHSPNISIDSNECILNRVIKILIYLNTNYPEENWGQYLDLNNDPNYSKIIFSGHSQGGGHAALISKYYPIHRAVCFSSPKDWRNFSNSPPIWFSTGSWQTGADRIYCFNHVLDEHTRQLEIWDSLGIDNFGQPTNVDLNTAPYNNTRQLTTSYAVPTGDEHASTIQDNKTPRVSGIPVFIPVWTYMLTDNLTTGLSATANDNINLNISPNPTNDVVELELVEDSCKLMIYDKAGKCVHTQFAQTGILKLDMSTLSPGVYIVQAISENTIYTGKLIKQ